MPLLIAVDLGSHAAKVTTYRTSGRTIEFDGHTTFPVRQDGSLPTLDDRLMAFQALLDDHPTWANGTAEVGFVMPGSELSYRLVELPFTDTAQVEKTLPFAIEGEVPYDLEDMALGWRTAQRDGVSRVMSVLAKNDSVKRYVDAMAERNLDPSVVVPDGELLAEYTPTGVSAVVDIGHSQTIVSVVVDGDVQASRSISVAGLAFTSAIQKAMDCEWHQAEAMKHGQVVDTDATDVGTQRSGYATLPPPARTAIDAAIGQLLAEIRSTLIRFEDNLEVEFDRILLCGGGSRIPELWDYLAGDLGLPVEPIRDGEGSGVPETHATSHALARNMAGLARIKPVDLRVGDLVYRGGTSLTRSILLFGGLAGGLFVVAALALFAFKYTTTMADRSNLNDEIVKMVVDTIPTVSEDQITDRSMALATMTGFTSDIVAKSALLPPANPDKPPTVDSIYALTDALPPHEQVPVELSNLDILGELITFEGETTGFAQSAQIEETLQKVDRFKRATKDNESKNKGKVKFKFSIPLGEEKKEEG